MGGTEQEKFAVVDRKDKVVGCVTGKKSIHNLQDGEYHRGVHVFVEVTGGRFVLQLKAPRTENEGKWSSAVSGHVRYGEEYEEAAIRETEEEIGLKIFAKDLEKVASVHPCEQTGWEFVTLYTYLMDDDEECIKLNKDEVKEVLVCKLDDVVEDVDKNEDAYSPAFVTMLNLFLELYKQ